MLREFLAQSRAEQAGPVFFSGAEALREVAKPDGLWNWALVAPDLAGLPLAGGGMGGVQEISGVVGHHAHSFGLMRLTFGVGAEALTKFVCIHAMDPIDSGSFSSSRPEIASTVWKRDLSEGSRRARAISDNPALVEALLAFPSCVADIRIQSLAACTLEHVVRQLCTGVQGEEAKLITEENLRAAIERHREQHPEVRALEAERQEQMKHVELVKEPRPEAVQPEREGPVSTETLSRLRKKAKLYSKGDMVEFWSASRRQWMLDGEVSEVTPESRTDDGLQIAAGSLMILFSNGKRFEWLAPQLAETHLRPSPRPKAALPVTGNILKEDHGCWTVRQWRYIELSKGFLRWWGSEDSARSGAESEGTVYLLGLQQQRKGLDIHLRASSTRGIIYTFQATAEDEAEVWSQALWAHAGYCQELRRFAKKTDLNTLSEALLPQDSKATLPTMCSLEERSQQLKSQSTACFGRQCSFYTICTEDDEDFLEKRSSATFGPEWSSSSFGGA